MNHHIYIIALHAQGKILGETYEAVSFAHELNHAEKSIIIFGTEPSIGIMADELAVRTGMDVLAAAGQSLDEYCAEAYICAILKIIDRSEPFTLCIPHTSIGYDFAPGLAAALGAPCITAVEEIHNASFTRSVCSGKIRVHTRPTAPSSVLTILPGAWDAYVNTSSSKGSVRIIPLKGRSVFTTTHGIKPSPHRDVSFADAEIIISAGRGIGKQETLSLIQKLAEVFPRSAVGATRAVCDLGWINYSHQIGSTGNTVSPRVYIACGISGAVQHISGMKDSGIIIAINTDPYAAVFRYATYCIVEDITTFIPLVMEQIDQALHRG